MILVKMVDSEGALGSSQGRSFLAPEITCFDRFDQVGQKRETGSIRYGEISGGSGGFWDGSWDSGIPWFHPKFTCF